MDWFQGSIGEAIQSAKLQKAFFVVVVHGKITHDFCIIRILREINFGSAKSAISTHLEALNFDFYAFLHFFEAEIHQINKIQNS